VPQDVLSGAQRELFSQPRTRKTVRTHHQFTNMLRFELRLRFGFTESYAIGVGQSQRARVQHADTLQHPHRAHGALRLCWYSRRCKGAYAVESRVLYHTLYRALRRVRIGYSVEYPRDLKWVTPTSTQVCTQKRTHDGRARNRAPEHSSFDCDWPAPVVSMLKNTPLKPLVEDIEKQPRG